MKRPPSFLDETQAYLNELGLNCLPFANVSDERFVYLSESEKGFWTWMDSIIESASVLLVLFGPAGSGKTTQLERVSRMPPGKWHSGQHNAANLKTPALLLAALGQDLQVSLEGHTAEEKINELIGHWESFKDRGITPIVMIDDAHLLSPELLEVLSRISQLRSDKHTNGLLHPILFSDDSLKDTLLGIDYCRMHIHQITELSVLHLTTEMTADYLTFRLNAAGYRGMPLFTAAEVNQLCRESDGLPAKLNLLAQKMLLNKSSQNNSADLQTNKHWTKVLFGTSSAATVGLAFVMFNLLRVQGPVNDFFTTGINFVKTDAHSIPVVKKSNLENKNISKLALVPQSLVLAPAKDKQAVLEYQSHINAGEQWLSERDPNHYTIQLISGSHYAALQTFMEDHDLKNQALLVRSLKKDRVWYSVVLGDYPTFAEVTQAINQLNPNLVHHHPWRRKIAAIQEEAIKPEI